jgi:urease accessory protein
MKSLRFIRALQVTDSFFPVGAFAYSDGLEAAAAAGRVRDAVSLGGWMNHFLESVFVPCEGLALVKCMFALKENDLDSLCRVDEELTAIRPAAAVRAASTGAGKRLLSLYSSMTAGGSVPWKAVTLPYTNAAAAYALVFFHCGIDERDAAQAFGYNRLAGIVSAALRLISLGQQQGQNLLTKNLNNLPAAVDRILEMKDEPLRSFNSLLDIEQMNHQYVYSRLFRS